MRQRLIAYVASAALMPATPGDAQGMPGNLMIVRNAKRIAFLRAEPRPAGRYGVGNTVLSLPLVWESGATLTKPLTIRAGVMTHGLPTGAKLRSVWLGREGIAPIQAYCTAGSLPPSSPVREIFGDLLSIVDASDAPGGGQICLIDGNDDGVAEQSVAIGGGDMAARIPVAIEPVALDRQRSVPISDGDTDSVRVSISDVSPRALSVTFRVDVLQHGVPLRFKQLNATPQSTTVKLKGVAFPYAVEILGERFDVLSVDAGARQVVMSGPTGTGA